MSLKEYHRKRHFQHTPEPRGGNKAEGTQYLYVVQKHAASHLHYDFRLELDGVLKSWAVPKGPSLDPSVKRLAMQVEDHPIEYGDFEGIIPPGQYGAGTVMLWDKGTWQPLDENVTQAYHKGDLTFILHGEKLKGRWKLIKIKGKNAQNGKAWLLFKVKDPYSKKETAKKITTSQPRSVATNRSLEEIAEQNDHIWTKKGEVKNKSKDTTQTKKIDFSKLAGVQKKMLPKAIKPELATLMTKAPLGSKWLHEIKWDGYRLIAIIKGNKVTLLTRHQKDWTSRFSGIAKALQSLNVKTMILDGEVIALDANNLPNFQILQNSMQTSHEKFPLIYYVFDFLYYDGFILKDLPLIERKKLLKRIVFNKNLSAEIRFNDHVIGNGADVFHQACALGMEGIVSKRVDAIYKEKRTQDWLKIKCIKRQEFVIVGFSETTSSRQYFKALQLGFYNKDKKLQYCGQVGTGFTEKSLRDIAKLLANYEQKNTAVEVFPEKPPKNVHWLKPKLLAEVEYSSLTDKDILRHPSFKGLREDKDPKSVTLELVKTRIAKEKKSTTKNRIQFTNLDRVLYPEQGITKQDLLNYYELVADRILPYITNRPLTIVRCPKGNREKCFYQKHINESVPDVIKSIDILEHEKRRPYLYIDDYDGLLGLVQMGVLEIHPWGSRIKNIEKPDYIVFDLDPDERVKWSEVVKCAHLIHDFLQDLELQSFVKTTGGKGLHIVIPIRPLLEWSEIKTITKKIADHIVATNPKKYIATMSKEKRSGKIFIDYLRNTRGATAVAVFSTRAKNKAPISVPLSWDELTPKIKSNTFNIKNIAKRLHALKKDPWQDFLKIKQGITQKVRKKLS